MIKVIVELHPYGLESHKQILEEFTIANKGTGTNEHGNYVAKFHGDTSIVHIENYERRKGVLRLMKKAITKLYLEDS